MKRTRAVYIFAVVLMVTQVVYALAWAVQDVAARLRIWPAGPTDIVFVKSLPLIQEVLFFGHVATAVVALVLLLRRSWYALPVFFVSFALDRSEWVLMTGNPFIDQIVDNSVLTPITFTLQGVLLALLLLLAFDGSLKRGRASEDRARS